MNNDLDMKIRLEFDLSYFQEDFLDTEARYSLAIRGDDLLMRLKESYRESAKQFGKLFTRDILYDIKTTSTKIKLVGIHM